MITARDMAIPRMAGPAPAIPPMAMAPTPATATFSQRLLLVVLYISVLLSSFVYIQPSPHDAMMVVLAIVCIATGVRFERKILPLFVLLLLFNIGGLIALMNVPGQEKNIEFAGISVYLALAAIMYACLFADNTLSRLRALRSAYILTAIFTTLFGLAAYYHLVPHHDTFIWAGRVRSTFKDPNVFGPFLVLPVLFLITTMITRQTTVRAFIATLILLVGIFFSFSRGAWLNFTVSISVTLVLLFLTAPNFHARMRPVALALMLGAVVAVGLVALLSIPAIHHILLERAHLTQSYDVGQGGRFELQELAFGLLFDEPFGMGPFAFASTHVTQQHQVYLQAFLVYGWLGGISFITLVVLTLAIGLRNVFRRSPWQLYLIPAYAAFVGIVCESFIIDSDHWRHFFLILGIIWGLSAANSRLGSDKTRLNAPSPTWKTA